MMMPLNESQIIIRETFRSEIPSYCNAKSPAGPRHNCNLDSKVYHQTKANCNIFFKEPRIDMVFHNVYIVICKVEKSYVLLS